MKKPCLFILLILVTRLSFGEDSTAVSRFSIGVNFSADYCYRSLSATTNLFSQNITEFKNEIEIEKFGYTFGISGSYKINRTISIELGAQYSNKGYQYDLAALTFGDMIDPRFGFIYSPGAISNIKFVTSYYYLDVPARVLFSFGKKKLHFITSAGIITNFLLHAENKSSYDVDNNGTHTSKSSLSSSTEKINVSPSVSIGAEYNISNKFFLRTEPTFQYGLISISKTGYIDEYLWSAGFNVSGYFRF